MFSNTSPNTHLLNYLRFQTAQLFNTVESQSDQQNHPERLNFIKAKLSTNDLSLLELFTLEQELIQLYPENLLTNLYMERKTRYMSSLPTEGKKKLDILEAQPTANTTEDQRTRLNTIFKWLQDYYYFINQREIFIHDMKSNFIIMLVALVFITLVSGYYCLKYQGNLQISLLIGMACGGYLGAIISTVQRIQTMAETPVDGADREAILLKIYQGRGHVFNL